MLNDTEIKLLRLALDKGAATGEIDNAAVMFVRKLRERGISADDFINQMSEENNIVQCRRTKMTFGKYEGEMLADIPLDYLIWVLRYCWNIKSNLRSAIEKVVFMGGV